MKLYIDTKKMTFEEDNIEHEIILLINDEEFYGYDRLIELPDNDKFIKDILNIVYKKDNEGKDTKEIENKLFIVREQKTWDSFPLYEYKNGEIISFDYTKYIYFKNTNRRAKLSRKINSLYNMPSELKILRKTINYILKELNLNIPDDYDKMNMKIEEIINNFPKEKIK